MRSATRKCLGQREWLRLVDGEVSENRAPELRAHAASCPACADELAGTEALVARIGAPLPEPPSDGVVAVMARLDEAPRGERRWSPAFLLGGAAGAAAAAALLLVIQPWRGPADGGAFAGRGGEVSWASSVGVELWAVEVPLRRLGSGSAFTTGTPIVATYSNAGPSPAWLLAFALDAGNEAHWLYPAFLHPASDPGAVRLEPSAVQRAFADSAVLSGLAPGPVRLVLLVAREPMPVSAVERLPPAQREPEALRARWPGARIDVIPARAVAPASGREPPR